MRFKPPPPNSPIGWRVEFRSMEVQLTDFENAAFTVFIVLLTRAILSFNLNLYIPITKVGRAPARRRRRGERTSTSGTRARRRRPLPQVDENMQTAHTRDAARTGLFNFRNHIFPPGPWRASRACRGRPGTTNPAAAWGVWRRRGGGRPQGRIPSRTSPGTGPCPRRRRRPRPTRAASGR